MCSTTLVRWNQQLASKESEGTLPGLSLGAVAPMPGHLRTVQVSEFPGIVFHEVIAKSALNPVAAEARMPFKWSINPYRGCSHACVYCFARGSHRYLDLDTGRDFDSQIVVKMNIAEVLRRELNRPSWKRQKVALGTNTDPYQRAEGRYRLMPGIINALVDSYTPFSILTKGSLVRRDLPLLAEARQQVRASLSMSIAIGDPMLQRSVEPGTPSTTVRLETVAAAREAGIPVQVFVMPILPYLSDSTSDLSDLLRRIKEAGATSVVFAPLDLRTHVRPWFMQWLDQHYPDLVPAYQELYPGKSRNPSKEYRQDLASRIWPLIDQWGLRPRSQARPPVIARPVAIPELAVPSLF